MPTLTDWSLQAPLIEAIGQRPSRAGHDIITTKTYIQILGGVGADQIYFTTDGTEPAPFTAQSPRFGKTFLYKGRFHLKAGKRTVRAAVFTRGDKRSEIATKTFKVLDEPSDLSSTPITTTEDSESTVCDDRETYRVDRPGLGLTRPAVDDFDDDLTRVTDIPPTHRSTYPTNDIDTYFNSTHPVSTGYHYRNYDSDGGSDGGTDVTNYFKHRPHRSRSRSRSRSRPRNGISPECAVHGRTSPFTVPTARTLATTELDTARLLDPDLGKTPRWYPSTNRVTFNDHATKRYSPPRDPCITHPPAHEITRDYLSPTRHSVLDRDYLNGQSRPAGFSELNSRRDTFLRDLTPNRRRAFLRELSPSRRDTFLRELSPTRRETYLRDLSPNTMSRYMRKDLGGPVVARDPIGHPLRARDLSPDRVDPSAVIHTCGDSRYIGPTTYHSADLSHRKSSEFSPLTQRRMLSESFNDPRRNYGDVEDRFRDDQFLTRDRMHEEPARSVRKPPTEAAYDMGFDDARKMYGDKSKKNDETAEKVEEKREESDSVSDFFKPARPRHESRRDKFRREKKAKEMRDSSSDSISSNDSTSAVVSVASVEKKEEKKKKKDKKKKRSETPPSSDNDKEKKKDKDRKDKNNEKNKSSNNAKSLKKDELQKQTKHSKENKPKTVERFVDSPRSTVVSSGSSVITPKVAKDPRSSMKKSRNGMNFVNDSGTQINVWGTPPENVKNKMNGAMGDGRRGQMAQTSSRVKPASQKSSRSNSFLSQQQQSAAFAMTNGVTMETQMPRQLRTPRSYPPEMMVGDAAYPPEPAANGYPPSYPPTMNVTNPAQPPQQTLYHTAPSQQGHTQQLHPAAGGTWAYGQRSGPAGPVIQPQSNTVSYAAPQQTIQKSQQQEQQSIGDSFRKFFSGWGFGSKQSKNGDPRSTVNEIGKNEFNTYEQIRTQCQEEGQLWEDAEFPACDSSLYYENPPVEGNIEWKRPHEICKKPKLFVSGASRFDVKQGVLGNCWLLAATAALTADQKLLEKVVPPDQTFSGEGYTGVFRFNLWQYGRWYEVCVDDRLPTKDGELIYMYSQSHNEFWSPLLEKAYAKLCGCYESLSGGLTSEALEDFSGGVVERYNFREELPHNMFSRMLRAAGRGALMGCSIDADGGVVEEKMDNGLIKGHAYTITAVKKVETERESLQLVRVRNPWGNEAEWTGAWSDGSAEWESVPETAKIDLGLMVESDGEFWMSYQDFSANFQRVEICLVSDDSGHQWAAHVIEGSWKRKANAGGCRNFPNTFHTNPQYRVEVLDLDDDDDDDDDVGATMVVGLMQKDRRKAMREGKQNLTIGYEIYLVQDNSSGPLDRSFFRCAEPVVSSPSYINMREVCGRHKLPVGTYVIVPTTFEPNEEADFVIRVFTEKPTGCMVELDEVTGVVNAQKVAPVQSSQTAKLMIEADNHITETLGEDGEVDAYELRTTLNSIFKKDFPVGEFDINLCRSLVAMRDKDQTATLNRDEFLSLWDELTIWKNAYKQYDKDNNGHFSSCELREALKGLGYQTSNATFSAIVARYSDRKGNIQFDDFVACIARLQTMFDTFAQKFENGSANFSLDEFIQFTMYS